MRLFLFYINSISSQSDRASAAETLTWSSNLCVIKPKTIKTGIHRFTAALR